MKCQNLIRYCLIILHCHGAGCKKSPWISHPLKYLRCFKEWIDVVGLNPKSKLFLFGTVCAGVWEPISPAQCIQASWFPLLLLQSKTDKDRFPWIVQFPFKAWAILPPLVHLTVYWPQARHPKDWNTGRIRLNISSFLVFTIVTWGGLFCTFCFVISCFHGCLYPVFTSKQPGKDKTDKFVILIWLFQILYLFTYYWTRSHFMNIQKYRWFQRIHTLFFWSSPPSCGAQKFLLGRRAIQNH